MSVITKPIMLDETGQAIVTQLQRASALQGPPGDDYVLTTQDKEDIAALVDISGKIDEPTTEGTAGQVLTTDGQGGRSWQTVQGGGGGELELIASGELSEDADRIYIDEDNSGNTFALEEMVLGVYNKASSSNTGEGFGKICINLPISANVNRDGRVGNLGGFFRKSGQQSTVILYVKLIKLGQKYQFMTTYAVKNDNKLIENAGSFQVGLGGTRNLAETSTVSSSMIQDGITSVLIGTDSGKKFGPGSFYLLFGKGVE